MRRASVFRLLSEGLLFGSPFLARGSEGIEPRFAGGCGGGGDV
jgi:hypothetical protein